MILGLDPIYIMVLIMLGVILVIGFMTYIMFKMLKELRGITHENRKLRKFVATVHRDNMLLARGIRSSRDIEPDVSERSTSGNLNYMQDSRSDITVKLPRFGNAVATSGPMPRG